MPDFRIVALDPSLSEEVRRTRLAPGYGHPVHGELATGTGPCRSCLRLFDVGRDERLLFTYRPWSGEGAVGAPGPVFIHARECHRFDGAGVPEDLLGLDLLLEARTHDGRTIGSERAAGGSVERRLGELLGGTEVDFVFIRHGEAGCHIARVERA
jgi:hypothetical protein